VRYEFVIAVSVEIVAPIYKTTRSHILEDSNLKTFLKSTVSWDVRPRRCSQTFRRNVFLHLPDGLVIRATNKVVRS
jgi:hypothetical protein